MHRMDRKSLEYFIAVAEHGSISRAAEVLRISQPALSRSIASLERELGMPLFQRVTKGVVITDIAQRLLNRARTIVSDFETLIEETHSVEGTISGNVRVAFSVSLVDEPVTAIISMLMIRHRDVTIDAWGHHNTSRLIASVDEGGQDIVIVGSRHPPSGRGLVVEKIYEEEILLALPAGSALAGSERISPADLAGLPFIAEPQSPIRDLLDELAKQHSLRVVARISYRQGLLPMVENGVGLALVTDSLRRFAGRTQVVVRGFDPPFTIPIWMVTKRDLTPASAMFATIARDHGREIRRRAGLGGPATPAEPPTPA